MDLPVARPYISEKDEATHSATEADVLSSVLLAMGDTAGRDLYKRVFALYQRKRHRWLNRELPRLVGTNEIFFETDPRHRRRWLYDLPSFEKREQQPRPWFPRARWPRRLERAIDKCAQRWHLVRNGKPPEWWWDLAENALHCWAIGYRGGYPFWPVLYQCQPVERGWRLYGHPVQSRLTYSGSIPRQRTRHYEHTGVRIARDKLARNVMWFVAWHLEGKSPEEIADSYSATHAEGCEPATIYQAVEKIRKILGLDRRP